MPLIWWRVRALEEYRNPVTITMTYAAPPVASVVVLVYDFETTGLSTKTAEITQLSIMTADEMNNRSYSAYFIPDEKISYGAAKVTGIAVERDENGHQFLTRNGVQLPTVSPAEGILQFVLFIESALATAADGSMVLLVAHNGHRFDVQFLVRYMQRFNVHTHAVWTRVLFGDSLHAARNLNYSSLKLSAIHAETCPDSTFDAHNATGDCLALTKILAKWRLHPDHAIDSTFLALFAPKNAHEMMYGCNDLVS